MSALPASLAAPDLSGPVYYETLLQGSDEWLAARCGLLTASEMKLIVNLPGQDSRVKKDGSPFKKREASLAENDKSRAHLWELLAQRITGHVEPHFSGDDQMRGHEDEMAARDLYSQHYAPVEEVGFITNSKWGFTLGYSPDGLVGDDGLIECKSRRAKYQMQTLLDGAVPSEYMLQIQTGLLVSERKWLDFISYSGGLPMLTIRVYPDAKIQDAILAAATEFEQRLRAKLEVYRTLAETGARLIPTERKTEQEMFA